MRRDVYAVVTLQSLDAEVRVLDSKVEAFKETIAAKFKAVEELDHVRNMADKEALKVALEEARRTAETIDMAFREYKVASNEWRGTVTDLTVRVPSREWVEQMFSALTKQIEAMKAVSDQQIRAIERENGQKFKQLDDKYNVLLLAQQQGSGVDAGKRGVREDQRANLSIIISIVVAVAMVATMLLTR